MAPWLAAMRSVLIWSQALHYRCPLRNPLRFQCLSRVAVFVSTLLADKRGTYFELFSTWLDMPFPYCSFIFTPDMLECHLTREHCQLWVTAWLWLGETPGGPVSESHYSCKMAAADPVVSEDQGPHCKANWKAQHSSRFYNVNLSSGCCVCESGWVIHTTCYLASCLSCSRWKGAKSKAPQ